MKKILVLLFGFTSLLFSQELNCDVTVNTESIQQESRDLLWIRQEFINSDFDWGKTVVYGHTPLQEPYLTATRMGLDTGCVYGRQLTCCDIRSRQFWQA